MGGDEAISSIKHPAVAEARRRTGQFSGHDADCYLADGLEFARQAVEAGAPIESLFFLEPVEEAAAELLARAAGLGVACHVASRGVFFKVLGVGYETGVCALAVVRRPAPAEPWQFVAAGACLLVGECIQDPRNVGVLVRTADAFAARCAVFTADSADPWSRAAVRSSTGSIFRVPVSLVSDLPSALERLRGLGVRVVGTSAHAERPLWETDLSGACAVVLGNETRGLSEAARSCCDELVTIPMAGGAHSLNVTVAGGIVLAERARQLQSAGLSPNRPV